MIGQTNGNIQLQTTNPNYGLIATYKNAHGCDSANNCWINYIIQLSKPAKSLIVTAGDDHAIKLWSINPSNLKVKLLCTLLGHTDWVYETLEITSIPDRLASASKDGTVRIWSPSKCKLLQNITIGVPVLSLENLPTGTKIVTGDNSGHIISWDLTSGTNTTFATLPYKVNDLWVLGDSNQYLGATTSNNCNGNCAKVTNYDAGSMWLLNLAKPGFNYKDSTTYTSNYIHFVYGDTFLADSLKLDLPAGSMSAHSDSVRIIEPLSGDNNVYPIKTDLLATGSSDGTTRLWSIANKTLVEEYECHEDKIYWAISHTAQSSMANASYWLYSGSLDTNVNTYSVPNMMGNPLKGAYTTGQNVSTVRVVMA